VEGCRPPGPVRAVPQHDFSSTGWGGVNSSRSDLDPFPKDMWDTLIMQGEWDFYGVDSNSFCLGSGDTKVTLEAIEDESDGYRSYFGCFSVSPVGKVFFRSPLARVRARETEHGGGYNKFRGWELVDVASGHVWLRVGTEGHDDYYPCFTFEYAIPGAQHEFR